MDTSFVPINRPKWRANKRKDTAVKVYTIAQESKYILIFNVPVYATKSDVIQMIRKYGEDIISCLKVSSKYDHDDFTDVYSIKFNSIITSRIVKRKCDEFSLLGNHLHIQYAPELENINETKDKFIERTKTVAEIIQTNKKIIENKSTKIKSNSSIINPIILSVNEENNNVTSSSKDNTVEGDTDIASIIRNKLKRKIDKPKNSPQIYPPQKKRRI